MSADQLIREYAVLVESLTTKLNEDELKTLNRLGSRLENCSKIINEYTKQGGTNSDILKLMNNELMEYSNKLVEIDKFCKKYTEEQTIINSYLKAAVDSDKKIATIAQNLSTYRILVSSFGWWSGPVTLSATKIYPRFSTFRQQRGIDTLAVVEGNPLKIIAPKLAIGQESFLHFKLSTFNGAYTQAYFTYGGKEYAVACQVYIDFFLPIEKTPEEFSVGIAINIPKAKAGETVNITDMLLEGYLYY